MVSKACPSATFSHTNPLTISDVSSGMDFPQKNAPEGFWNSCSCRFYCFCFTYFVWNRVEFKATVMTKSGIGIVQNGVEKSGQLGLEKTQGLDTLAAPPSRSSCETIETQH